MSTPLFRVEQVGFRGMIEREVGNKALPVRLATPVGPKLVLLLGVGEDYIVYYEGDETHERYTPFTQVDSIEFLPASTKWK